MKKLQPKVRKQEEVKQEPKFDIEYNDYEYKFYEENAPGAMPEYLQGNRYDIGRFKAAVDPNKPIRRKVSRMYRIKALDLLSDDKKPKRREFLTVVEDWYGKRADGTDVPPVSEHKNGVYNELKKNPDGSIETTNNLIYYIPFDKETVDEWIDLSYGTDKETIQFWVDTKQGSKRKQVEYDDFVNKSWDELVEMIDRKTDYQSVDVLVKQIERQQKQIDELLEANKDKQHRKTERREI